MKGEWHTRMGRWARLSLNVARLKRVGDVAYGVGVILLVVWAVYFTCWFSYLGLDGGYGR